jgi:hypothetical protein
VGEPRTWKRAQSVLGKGGGERESDLANQMESPFFVTIKCIKVLPYKLYYFENAEFFFFQRPILMMKPK